MVLFTIHTMFADGLGIRYIIGVLPFTCLAGGLGLAWLVRSGSIAKRCAAGVLCAWLIVAAAGIYPDQLSYFNEMACLDEPGKIGLDGGSRCGPMWLDDSNVDWGQGLKQLSDWLDANAKGRPVRLAYFGSFPPEVYGLPPQSENLSSMDLMRVPEPGLYAVSTHHVRPHERHDRTVPPGLGLDADYPAASDRGARLLHLRYPVSRTTCSC